MRLSLVNTNPFDKGRGRGNVWIVRKNNTYPRAKIMLREWLCDELHPRSVFECYGGGGLGSRIWKAAGVKVLDATPENADAITTLETLERWDYDVFDVDPYSSPFEALAIIAQRATKQRLGLYITDGVLRIQAQVGGYWPKLVAEVMSWDNGREPEGRWLKRWVYWQYPAALRAVIAKVLAPRYQIASIKVVLGQGRSIANYAAVVCEATPCKKRRRARSPSQSAKPRTA